MKMHDLDGKLKNIGLTFPQLLQEESTFIKITEPYLKLLLIRWNRKLDPFKSQSPDYLQRLIKLERLGQNPHGESQIDIAEMVLGVPDFNRLRFKPFD